MTAPRILVVEDERIVAMNLQVKLEALGYRVPALASSGRTAVALATELKPDLVLMDIRLDEAMDGVEAAAVLRERLGVPIVFLTAYSTRDIVERAKVTEPFGYILKPVSDRELHVVIEIALYRHRMEQQLLDQKRLLAATLQSIGDGVVATDVDGRVTFLNPVAEAATGWPLADAHGRPVEEVLRIIDEKTGRAVELPVHRAIREKAIKPMGNHVTLIARDGIRRPIDDSAAPILDEGGQVRGGVLVFQDVTAKRAVERVANDLAAIVSSSPDAIVGFSTDDLITSWNPAAERLYGHPAAAVLGRSVFLIVAADRQGEFRKTLARLEGGEAVPPHEAVCRRRNGTAVEVNVALSAVRDADGHVTGFAQVVRDITDLRLLQSQFRQAQKMEAVGRLASGVAHDFNNLLTVIVGYSGLMLETLPPDGRHREAAAEIREAGERASKLTGQLLAFSRQQVLEPVVLDLNEVATNSGRLLQRLIGEDITVVLAPAPDLWRVKADTGQIEQVLMNLAVNARDAMPRGGRLTIATANADLPNGVGELPPGRYVRLAVSDTGTGMTADVLARLFEPFFTTKPPGQGTGLGLPMVYGIVTQSGGYVGVTSAVGAGTTFDIFLPASADEVDEPSDESSKLRRPVGGSETVLLVEDDPSVRHFAVISLQMQGYTVLEAGTGAEAIRLADAHADAIQVVVTDVVMPEMGGRQLVDALRGRRPGLKALFMSGYLDDAVSQYGVVAGTDHFLNKPFAPLALARKVRAVLDS